MSQKDFLKTIYSKHATIKSTFPDKEYAHQFIDELFAFLFVPRKGKTQKQSDVEKEYESLKSHLSTLLYDVVKDGDKTQQITESFFTALPSVYDLLLKDAAAISQYDPAAESTDEVLVAYPGFYATAAYRFAHLLWKEKVALLPRLLTEYAHSKTGIDIHPGAEIGESFFIDHGTGVVIGETTIIGNNVKIYQGVTIGALNAEKEKVSGKRHPTIEDSVIIYSGATILGGKTVIGRDTVVGGNVWITYSVPANSIVYHKSEVVSKQNFSFKDSVDEILKTRQNNKEKQAL